VLEEPISVLLVDDRPEKLLALEAILADLSLHLVRATSGRDALRLLLRDEEYALILLDINMPGLDGFETAQLIRQRKSTEHTPIIFITAYQDEMFMARGYSLGAVDYILQPVMAEVLRSKVSVFVDLYRKNRLVRQQVRLQEQRASQLEKLAEASVAINAARSMEQTVATITQTAREIIGAHQGITLLYGEEATAGQPSQSFTSFSEKYGNWRGKVLRLDSITTSAVARSAVPVRMCQRELLRHEDWPMVSEMTAHGQVPPVHGMLAAPLLGKNGMSIGLIYLSDRYTGEFSAEDQSILVQLAQMGAVAIENILSAEAREANRAKDQFIAVLSHELRTPLTPVLATLSSMETDPRLPKDVLEDLSLIRRNVELEARLIDDLLDLTRISKGKVELQLAPVDAHVALRETLRICDSDAQLKELQITVALHALNHVVMADATRLQQIFWNILKNAVKFTPERGKILVTTGEGPNGELAVTVRDTGIGITPDVLPRIFSAFEQGRSSITRQFGGLGLGLAITKALVERHGGMIKAESAGHGHGTTLTLLLPVTSQRPVTADDDRHNAARVAPKNLAALRVLLAEDHPDTSRVMSRLLRQAGYVVDCTNSVAGALKLAASTRYDVLISDIGLSDGSGLDLMRQLLLQRPIYGVAISGYGMEQDVARSKAAGFEDHFTKPINFPQLLDRLTQIAGRDASRATAAE